MANRTNLSKFLTDIANAIRTKTGKTDKINAGDFDTEILSISVGTESNQHMPFYLLESDDEGNLWCVNNYSTMEYSPYELDIDGNLIVNQDDEDTAVYWINENMELEVEVNG